MKEQKGKKIKEIILKNMNKAIEETGLSRQKIAEELGVDYSTVWRLLKGQKNIKPEYIAEIAYLTYRTPNDFFYVK